MASGHKYSGSATPDLLNPWADVSHQVGVYPVDDACIDVSHLEQRRNLGVPGTTINPNHISQRTVKDCVPPRPPEPITRRRMLRHNVIEAWETTRKTGWRPCALISE